MKNILAITTYTLKEILRDKILYGIIGFGVIFLILIFLLSSLSLGNDIKLVKDLGLGLIYLFALVLAIYFGSLVFNREFDNGTYKEISLKPVPLLHFVVGKFLGVFLGLVINLLFFNLLYFLVVLSKKGGADLLSLFQTLLLIFEMAVVLSLALLFSTRFNQLVSIILTACMVIIGHMLPALREFGDLPKVLNVASLVLPNFEKFNLRDSIIFGDVPSSTTLFIPMIYALFYTVILLWMTHVSLKKHSE